MYKKPGLGEEDSHEDDDPQELGSESLRGESTTGKSAAKHERDPCHMCDDAR